MSFSADTPSATAPMRPSPSGIRRCWPGLARKRLAATQLRVTAGCAFSQPSSPPSAIGSMGIASRLARSVRCSSMGSLLEAAAWLARRMAGAAGLAKSQTVTKDGAGKIREGIHGRAIPADRQQEVFILVAPALAGAEALRARFRGAARRPRPARHGGEDRRLFALGPRALPAAWQRRGLGIPRHP